uniref:Uncharacterized protein n=1 Tax=Siphoviridae sp. ctnhN1 TaxID=2827589 RepID=A0A8S5LKR4_9CAUD|nr:MAG TPA: hypothetical protein [Siphoviridae sp. ctnhN1]
MEVIASCPHATQPMVNALLQTMKGYQYQAYEAGAANIDPAAELGDGVTVGGIYSPMSKLSDDGRGYAGISSPGEAEMEDEYPSEGYISQEFNRKIAETRSTITKTSEEIMLKVEGIDGKYTEVKTTLDGLTVTDASGTTKINGSSIKTDNLYVDAANIKGTLTADQIQTGSIRVGDLKDGSNYATKTYVDNNAGLSASEVDNAIATYIDSTSITAQKLRGQTVELLANSNTKVGELSLVETNVDYGIGIKTLYGGIKLESATNVYLKASGPYGGFITLSNNIVSLGGGELYIGSQMYGNSLPAGSWGKLFFLRQ